VVFIVSQSILKEFEEKEAVPRSSPRARSPSFFWAWPKDIKTDE